MSVGIVMLVHTALDRAEQAARHWAASGCPVVIHVDKSVPTTIYKTFTGEAVGPGRGRFQQAVQVRMGHLEFGGSQSVGLRADACEVRTGSPRLSGIGIMPAFAPR